VGRFARIGREHRFGRVSRGAIAAVGIALLATVSGCGIPVDAKPHALGSKDVPFDLLAPNAPTVPTTPSSTPGPIEVPVHIYLMAPTGQLVAANRLVPFPAPLDAVLTALVAGPTSTEITAGIQSAVPIATKVLSASISAGVAIVNLNDTFGQLVGPSQILAVAQIVFTATDLAGVSGVAFELTGQPVEVPVVGGAQVPVATRAQFASLAPPVTAASA
jgi:hypothetical protein